MADVPVTSDLINFLNASPTAFHAVDEAKKRLKSAGFEHISEREDWRLEAGKKYFFTRNHSTIVAFAIGKRYVAGNGFNIVAFMGKRLPAAVKIEAYARLASEGIGSSNLPRPKSKTLPPPKSIEQAKQKAAPRLAVAMDEGCRETRVPLAEVVSDCVKRWFQDTLKEARNGDQSMQVLVGQMYRSGYGVSRNEQKAKAWYSKASKSRPSVWKVSDKRPGYNASDSDSDEVKDDKN